MPQRASQERIGMNFALNDEQVMLRDSVRSFLADRVPLTRVRELMETDAGFDPELWAEMAQMGWQAMAIPEEYGGAGYSSFELGIILEEMGRMLTPAPFLSSVVLGANTILLAGNEIQKKELLPGIAAGERRVAVATAERAGNWDPAAIELAAAADGDDVVLSGTKSYVLDGHTADTLLVAARNADGVIDFYVVPADAAGVSVTKLETMDMTRKQAEIVLTDVRLPAAARLGEPGIGAATIEQLYDLAVSALAFEQVGGAQVCMEMSVEYAKVRVQFGRPIGSFQAIKHKCADMLVATESARSAAYYAGWAAAVGDVDLSIAAPLAKACCSDAYFDVAADTIQVHGGIGFTWEHDAHLYFKRAKTDQLLFGDSTRWRAELADRLGL
jgi:alkylation response protein AidB-like acyl-CoA dehydrogenase